jgi:nitrate reductase delta subunit
MARTFKAIALLLSYPDEAHRKAYSAALAAIREENLASATRGLQRLVDQLSTSDLLDLQARYVALFDRGRSVSLNLYEHVHGESRDRGTAMVELKALYAAHGLELSAHELPDYLPVFLEFLSVLPLSKARVLLGEAAHVIEALAERLKRRKSPYAAALAALASIVTEYSDGKALSALLGQVEDDPDDLEALDRAWTEEPVTFGPGDAGCPKAQHILGEMRK